MVALLVVGFDVVMADEAHSGSLSSGKDGEGVEGPLRVPTREYRFFAEAVPKPVGAYDVLIRRKKGVEGVRWGFEFGG